MILWWKLGIPSNTLFEVSRFTCLCDERRVNGSFILETSKCVPSFSSHPSLVIPPLSCFRLLSAFRSSSPQTLVYSLLFSCFLSLIVHLSCSGISPSLFPFPVFLPYFFSFYFPYFLFLFSFPRSPPFIPWRLSLRSRIFLFLLPRCSSLPLFVVLFLRSPVLFFSLVSPSSVLLLRLHCNGARWVRVFSFLAGYVMKNSTTASRAPDASI